MAEEIPKYKQVIKKEILFWLFVTDIVATVVKQILILGLEMPQSLAFALASTLIYLLAYPYFPKPRWAFRIYFTTLIIGIIGGRLAVEIIPSYLETFIPTVPAYGLPFILWSTLLYFTLRYFKAHNNAFKNS